MAFNWYSYGQPIGVAGMKADSTVDVIDSFAAEGAIKAGAVVERGTDPAKQVKASVTAANVIGVAIFENKVEETPLYPDKYAVPVMTFGDVYVEVADAVTAGTAVHRRRNRCNRNCNCWYDLHDQCRSWRSCRGSYP